MNGRQAPHRLRNAMALAAVACQSLSCEGDYPIAPTLCDDWCHTSERVSCGNYLEDPAECVARCESEQMPSKPECVAKFRSVIECLNQAPPTHDDCGQQTPVCAAEYAAFYECKGVSNGPTE